jgi:acetyl-CoA acetyltransferase
LTVDRSDGWGAPVDLDPIRGQVAIVGIGESTYSKASGRTAEEIAIEAAERAIEDAGLRAVDIDGLTWSASEPALDEAAFRRHFGVRTELFTSALGGGMTGAAMAPHIAALAIAEGRATHVLNTYAVAWATERDTMTGGPGEGHLTFPEKVAFELPFGYFPQPVYFATVARRHMIEFGTTVEQLGAIAVASRRHANITPGAVMHDRTMTLDEYLDAPMVADPLRVTDCCLISDGGAAFVTTSAERSRDLRQTPVLVAGVGKGVSWDGYDWSQQRAFLSTPQEFAAPGAFAMAGLGPSDVDVLAVYDPFTILSLVQIEDMGFCAKGEGGPFVAGDRLHYDGGLLPYNTHGGLLSHAYVLGIAHVVELVKQLRGVAAAQVAGCEVAAYGGYTGGDAATLILTRAS